MQAIFTRAPLARPSPPPSPTAASEHAYTAAYTYTETDVTLRVPEGGGDVELLAVPITRHLIFCTEQLRAFTHVGVMVVGLGGSNGSTLVATLLANKLGLSWEQRTGRVTANWLGSLTQSSTARLGRDTVSGRDVFVPLGTLAPMVSPEALIVGGWDICDRNLADAAAAARVLEPDLLRQLAPMLRDITPLRAPFYPTFIASNQTERATNVLPGHDKAAHVSHIREDIRKFKARHGCETVIVLWSGNTERMVLEGAHNDTAESLLASVAASHGEVSPSQVFAIASLQEGCPFINASPQNTLTRGLVDLAERLGGMVAGDDLKSGQTKLKSVLVDYLVSAGIKPLSIVSYNHLGNNDGRNLSSQEQFRSKEVSKSGVVEDAIDSAMWGGTSRPDHVVVIKYVPAVGDSKRAMDEYVSEIAMGGRNTLVIHNTCEDTLLAVPLLLDLIVLAELLSRITIRDAHDDTSSVGGEKKGGGGERLHPVQSLLSYLLKAPAVPHGAPIVNALHSQREALINVLKASRGLPPNTSMDLEARLPPPLGRVGLCCGSTAPPSPPPSGVAVSSLRRVVGAAVSSTAAHV